MKDIYLNQTTQATLAKAISSSTDSTNLLADEYVLKGLKDYEQVRVNLDSSGFNGLLQLMNASTGQPIATQNKNNSVLSFTALPDTNYVIRVTGKDANTTGNYELKTSLDGTTTATSNMTTQVISTLPNNTITISDKSIAQAGVSPTGVNSAAASASTNLSAQTISATNVNAPAAGSATAPTTSPISAPVAAQIALSASTSKLNPTTVAPSKSSVPVPPISLGLTPVLPAAVPSIPPIPPAISITAPVTSSPKPQLIPTTSTIATPVKPTAIPAIPPTLSISAPPGASSTPPAILTTPTIATPATLTAIPAIPPAIAIAAPPAASPTPPAVLTTPTIATPATPIAIPAIPPALSIAAPPAASLTPPANKTPVGNLSATPPIAPTAIATTTSTAGSTTLPVNAPTTQPLVATNKPSTTTTAIDTPANIPAMTPSLSITAPGATTAPSGTTSATTSATTPLGAAPIGTGITPNVTPTMITVGTNNLLNIQNGGAIQFTAGVSSAAFKNEMGAFIVDDEQGRINGILPGAAGYLAAAMSKSQVIGGSTIGVGGNRQLNFPAGSRLGFYLVQDGTTAQVKADLAAGKTPTRPVFFQTGNTDGSEHLKVTQSGNNVTFAWEDTVGGGDRDFNDLIINAKLPTNLTPTTANAPGAQSFIDLRDISGVKAASVTVGGSSSYDNFIGFYRVDDASGKIGTLDPSDAGYAQAALGRNVILYNKTAGNVTPTIEGGGILAPYIIANGTAQSFLANNPTNQGNGNLPHAYFGFIGANPDKSQHIQLLGDNKFGFEDAFGGGDRDFNDATAQIRVTA